MTVYKINGQPIHVRQEGPLDAPVAILIHGWCSSWYTWKPLLPNLSKRFRCVAVDLPGYGNSPAGPKPPTIDGYADLIAELIRQVSDRSVLLMGHSMGGQISMTLALRHKPLVERMVLLNPAVSGQLSSFINLWIAPLIFMERTPVSAQLVRLMERTRVGYSYTDRVLKPISFAERAAAGIDADDYARIRADARRPGQGSVRAACFTAMKKADLRGKMSGIEVPALVLWGAEDNTVPLRDAGSVAAEWPEADLRLIPNAGHWPQFEQFGITLRHISAFLGLPTLTSLADDAPVDGEMVSEVAQFLSNSDLGHELTLAQRTRLAAQFRTVRLAPGESIASENTLGDELYLVQQGQVEVWSMINSDGSLTESSRRIAIISAGQVVGEMALLDNRPRSADLRAGPQGARLLTLKRQRFDALCEDDPQLAQHVLRNIARALALRLRLQNWHLQLAEREFEKQRKRQTAA